ncbi:MAG TPA: hypothetical protein VOA87_23075 [Thermoanaerobaculia bacterium]|nr:hypothetical protein [Thermoanaerobaculia bacterium]
MNEDLEHLRLVSVFHYVVAGVAFVFSCFPLVYLFIGLSLIFGWMGSLKDPASQAFTGWFFVLFACFFMALGLTFASCLLLAGRNIARRVHYTYCLVMAGVACVFMPFGTALGVFTFLVLLKPSVKALFASPASAAA